MLVLGWDSGCGVKGRIMNGYRVKKQNSTLFEHTVPLVFLSFVVLAYLPADGQSPAY